jgi:hypothetical protein
MTDTVIKTVNCIKTRPLKSRLFAELWEEIGAQHQSLLFYLTRWLSSENVVARVYNFREVALFLKGENLVYAELYVSKLAYLNYISEYFNTLNIHSVTIKFPN